MEIVDYELQIGETFYYVDPEAKSVHKGICKHIDIKIYADDEDVTQTIINYLLDIDDDTVLADEEFIFETFTEAVTYLGTLFDPDEELA